MRRLMTWAALTALVLGLVLAVGCQQAQQQESSQGTSGTAQETGTTMESTGDSMHQMGTTDTMHQEAGDMMHEETGEATGTN